MRAALSKLLLKDPDVLLLDEPTNHLDIDATIWFEKYLLAFKGAVVLTSHDRTFLNNLATHVMAIEPHRTTIVRGNYDHFLAVREQTDKVQEAFDELNKIGLDLGGAGPALRTSMSCVGHARCEQSCYDESALIEQLLMPF